MISVHCNNIYGGESHLLFKTEICITRTYTGMVRDTFYFFNRTKILNNY